MSKTELVPPSDRVLVRQLPAEERTAFGLEIPQVAQERPLRAIVLAVGHGIPDPQHPGVMIPLGIYRNAHAGDDDYDGHGNPTGVQAALGQLWPGDEVVLPKYGGTEIEAEDGETIISILASEILAVIG